jgi:hypothetical protein
MIKTVLVSALVSMALLAVLNRVPQARAILKS